MAHYFTVITTDYALHARLLIKSIQTHCSPESITIFLADEPESLGVFEDLGCNLRLISQVLEPTLHEDLSVRYGAAEFCYACKPLLTAILLREGCGRVTFVDADCLFFAPPTAADVLLETNWLALTPHMLAGAFGDHYVDDRALLRSGSINIGFLAIRADSEAFAFLDWWGQRCIADCSADPSTGTYFEQKWLDLAMVLFPGIAIVRSPGFNVAYWNIVRRDLKYVGGSQFMVGGEPLVFAHFSRWSPLSVAVQHYCAQFIGAEEFQVGADAQVLLSHYADALFKERALYGAKIGGARSYATLPGGERRTTEMQRALWRNLRPGEGRRDDILAVLNAASPRVTPVDPFCVTNYYEEIWLSRPDIRYNKFDLDRQETLYAFFNWLMTVGRDDHSIPDCLLGAAQEATAAYEVILDAHEAEKRWRAHVEETRIAELARELAKAERARVRAEEARASEMARRSAKIESVRAIREKEARKAEAERMRLKEQEIQNLQHHLANVETLLNRLERRKLKNRLRRLPRKIMRLFVRESET